MDEEQVRLACIELAQGGNNTRGEPKQRAEAMAAWCGTDEVRLGCLKLAIKTHGNLARIGVDRILQEAAKYFEFVRPPKVEVKPTRRRGRPRKT